MGKKRSSRCTPCLAAVRREKRAAEPGKDREILKRSYTKHRDKRLDEKNSKYWQNPEAYREAQRRYGERNREKLKLQAKIAYRALRAELFAAYGGQCRCCGVTTPEFLTLDHVNGDGKLHRLKVGVSGVYQDLKRRGWPQEGFALLCWNCHMAKTHHGSCPHEDQGHGLAAVTVPR